MIHSYKLCGYNIIIDVASGCVHSVDDVTFDVIGLYGQHGDSPRADIARQIAKLHPDVTETDIRAITDEVKKLIADGKLFTKDNFEHIADAQAARDIHLKALCLNVSHECNMSCAYCFARPQRPQGDSPRAAVMPFDTGKKAIDFLIENSGEHKTLDIDFFGGEPLLNWNAVKEITAYANMAGKFTGKKFRFTLTTNGLLIDDDVIAFTNRHFHNVVLSLDGRPEVHGKMRKEAESDFSTQPLLSGTGSYNAVLPNIQKLVEARRRKGYYIRGTFTRENMDFTNDVFHLVNELGFSEISIEPVVTKHGDPLGFTKDDLPELFRQYDMLAIEMRRRRENVKYLKPQDLPAGERPFNFYHFNIDLEHSPCIHKRIAGCGVGTAYLAVTPDGGLYPCHQFAGDEEFLMGDVWQGITNKNLQGEFAAANIFTRSGCKTCWARYYCSGGCAANAHRDTGSIYGVYDIGCELFKKRLENAIMLKF